MTTDQIGLIVKELDRINDSVVSMDAKVDDVRERVVKLETSNNVILKLLGLLIAGTPVLFLVFDRIAH